MAGAVVQTGYNVDDSGGTSTTIAVTLTGVTAGNNLVVHGGWAGTGNTATVSDGSAFSTADAQRNDTTNNQASQVYVRENVGSGSHVITLTVSSAAAFRRIRAYEVSGCATASSVDKSTGQNQLSPGTGANGVSSGASAATTQANDFVMGFSQNITENDPGTGTVTAGTGFSLTGTNLIMCVESKSVAATGAQTATFTQSVNNARTTHVVAFKEAAGGGGTTVKALSLLGVG